MGIVKLARLRLQNAKDDEVIAVIREIMRGDRGDPYLKQLGQALRTDLATVHRTLAKLEKRGRIRLRRRTVIEIIDRDVSNIDQTPKSIER